MSASESERGGAESEGRRQEEEEEKEKGEKRGGGGDAIGGGMSLELPFVCRMLTLQDAPAVMTQTGKQG